MSELPQGIQEELIKPEKNTLHPNFKKPVTHLPGFDEEKWIPPVTRSELIEAHVNMNELQKRRCREWFPAFAEYCFCNEETGMPFQQQWFHDEWSKAMDTSKRLIIVAPRDHGKTSQMVARILWELGRNPNLRIKIACASDGKAKERLYEVVQNLMYNPRVIEIFPHLRPADSGEWSKHKIVIQRSARYRDASVEALGVTATATGGRADLLVADDVVDRRNALSFPALREQIKQAWKSDWTNLLEPDSRIWYICTLWHKDDLSHMLMENKAYDKLFYAVPDNFGALWDDKWNSAALIERHDEIGSVEFNRAFRNVAVDFESALVRPEWIKFKDIEVDEDFLKRFDDMVTITSYDTAGTPTGKATQDFAAKVILAIDMPKNKIYILEAEDYRKTVKEQAKTIIKDARRFKPFRAVVEKASQSAVDEWVINLEPTMVGTMEVYKPGPVNKGLRLSGATPLIEDGTIIFNETLNPDGDLWVPGRGSLVEQLIDFPFGRHDDLVDAFSQAIHIVRRYFLDYGADEGQNVIDITVGRTDEERKYII